MEDAQDSFWGRVEWDFEHLSPLWALGCRFSELSDFFVSIPHIVCPVLKKALVLLQDIATEGSSNPELTEASSASNQQVDNHKNEEGHRGYGITDILFDPETGQRKKIYVNSQMAVLVTNTTVDELMHRLANDDFNLIFPPLDLLFIMADEIRHDFGDRIRYFRIITVGNETRHATLICLFSEKEFNNKGRLIRVLSFIQPIFPGSLFICCLPRRCGSQHDQSAQASTIMLSHTHRLPVRSS
jgi:hypothetical protein